MKNINNFNGLQKGEIVHFYRHESLKSLVVHSILAILKFQAFLILFFIIFTGTDIIKNEYTVADILPFYYRTAFTLSCIVISREWIRWSLSIHLITDRRVIRFTNRNPFRVTSISLPLNKIQDVSYSFNTLYGTFLNYGSLMIRTAAGGSKWQPTFSNDNRVPEFEFVVANIDRPREVQNYIYEIMNFISMLEAGKAEKKDFPKFNSSDISEKNKKKFEEKYGENHNTPHKSNDKSFIKAELSRSNSAAVKKTKTNLPHQTQKNLPHTEPKPKKLPLLKDKLIFIYSRFQPTNPSQGASRSDIELSQLLFKVDSRHHDKFESIPVDGYIVGVEEFYSIRELEIFVRENSSTKDIQVLSDEDFVSSTEVNNKKNMFLVYGLPEQNLFIRDIFNNDKLRFINYGIKNSHRFFEIHLDEKVRNINFSEGTYKGIIIKSTLNGVPYIMFTGCSFPSIKFATRYFIKNIDYLFEEFGEDKDFILVVEKNGGEENIRNVYMRNFN